MGFWSEAVRMAAYLKNRCPHKAIGTTPYEAWYGKKPDLAHLRIFGSRCYAHLEEDNRKKLESHTIEGIFMGYYAHEGLYAIYDVNKRVIIKKRDVTFYEHLLGHPSIPEELGVSPGWNILGEEMPIVDIEEPELLMEDDVEGGEEGLEVVLEKLRPDEEETLALTLAGLNLGEEDKQAEEGQTVEGEAEWDVPVLDMIATRRRHGLITNGDWMKGVKGLVTKDNEESRKRLKGVEGMEIGSEEVGLNVRYLLLYEQLKIEYGIADDGMSFEKAVEESLPLSWKQAMNSVNRAFWLRAALEEMRAIATMGTFELTKEVPTGRRALPTKWVFQVKKDEGKIVRFKARWVARGDLQKKGLDYVDTFAPVVNLTTLRVILTKVAVLDLELEQLDVVSAFLNGDIDTLVFLRQPEGWSLDNGVSVCLLRKSLYGLCQAARVWYRVLSKTLEENGYKRLSADIACWVKGGSTILAHVDDMLVTGTPEDVEMIKEHLRGRFAIKELGAARMFVGLNIVRDRKEKVLWIDQFQYARSILELYKMGDCHGVATPMAAGEVLTRSETGEELKESEKRTYQAMIGSLGYIMTCSRPDLSFAVSRLAQFASCPAERHMMAVKRVFRYLKGTANAKIKIGGVPQEEQETMAYFDASFADDPNDRRSTFGYVLFYGDTAVLWKSKKHKAVSLSTTDAEYVAATEATRDVCWIENVFIELSIRLLKPVRMLGDNANANNLANGTTVNNRTRHIALRDRYVTAKAAEGLIRVEKVGTAEQVADMLTKPLPKETLMKHAVACGMVFDEHRCMICLRMFVSSNKLHGHLRSVHTEVFEGTY